MGRSKKRTIEKIIILSLAAVVAGLLVFFFKDVFFPFIRLEAERDFDGAKALLREKGVLGGATVSLIEALQMVVIFIPAEFIQISSGMSYPWYLAILLCDVGVVLGASVIYFIVHVFRFDGDIFGKGGRISRYDKKSVQTEKGVMILMYFLFVMPIIPFGAICYYSSNKKIRYSRYVFTCATGVIPSICTSILMGTAVKEFIANSLPIWLLMLVIVFAAAILFTLILFILKKFYFKEYEGTPDSPYYGIFVKICKIFLFGKCKVNVKPNEVKNIDGPFILLANHESFFDFYFATRVCPERNCAVVMNRHVYNNKLLHKYVVQAGMIPKKLFSSDMETIKGIMKAIKEGYPVVMFPEGRMSVDGTTNYVNPSVARLCKKLGVPVVLVKESYGYLVKPKWRKKYIKNKIDLEVKRIISAEELREMDEKSLYNAIIDNIYCNDFAEKKRIFKSKKKAEGLENVLYGCPVCGALYKTRSSGNELICDNCGTKHTIDDSYFFTGGGFSDISEYYAALAEAERKTLAETNISVPVSVKIFRVGDNGFDTDNGEFTLTAQGVSYKGGSGEFSMTVKELEAIAFSAGEEFEFYRENRLWYFYPVGDKKICARIALIYDLLKEKERNEDERSN